MMQQLQGTHLKRCSNTNRIINAESASPVSPTPKQLPVAVLPMTITPLQRRIRINNLHLSKDYYQMLYDERAGIYQYDAGMSQDDAEAKARNDVLNLWLEHEHVLVGHQGPLSVQFKKDNYSRGVQQLQKYGSW
ncbi:MAG: hypothetical protein JSS50_01680 [Proteobacteria bacterium]|nr:hypothetical protein [Pseudomonadota bacterium]